MTALQFAQELLYRLLLISQILQASSVVLDALVAASQECFHIADSAGLKV